jgi:FkbM family methyltransferase
MSRIEPASPNSPFETALAAALARGLSSFFPNNVDTWRFPSPLWRVTQRAVVDRILALGHRAGFNRHGDAAAMEHGMAYLVRNLEALSRLHDLLADDYSKAALVALLAFRVLGPRRVALPPDRERFDDRRRAVADYRLARRTRLVAGWSLDRYRIPGAAHTLELDCYPSNILYTFLLQQYAYHRGATHIAPTDADVVVDGGGCWGDTALYFADRVGASGHVYSFEFDDTNLDVFLNNLALNPDLGRRVTVIPHALSGEQAGGFYQSAGPSSRLSINTQPSAEARSVTIDTLDSFVTTHAVQRLDFVKLDIEGAEGPAVAGGIRTLQRFRPKLAISVYHRPEDLFEIPLRLAAIFPDYDFYLDHFTTHSEETVLFATPRQTPAL